MRTDRRLAVGIPKLYRWARYFPSITFAEKPWFYWANSLFFVENSARTAMNVEAMFRAIAMKLETGRFEVLPVQEEAVHRLPLAIVCRAARDITRVAFEHREWPH